MRQLDALQSGEDASPGTQKAEDWMEVGVFKMYEVSRLDDETLSKSLQSGKLKTRDGRELSIDDLKEMSIKAVADEVKKLRGKYTEKVTTQEQEIQLLRAELKKLGKEFADTASKLSLYEEKYREKAVKLDEKERCLDQAYEYLNKFHRAIAAADIEEDDPERLLVKLKTVVQSHQLYWRDSLYRRYSFALDSLDLIK